MRARYLAVALWLALAWAAQAGEYVPAAEKFKACENKTGAGFFWVDTTSGRTWWADPGAMKWMFWGQPEDAQPGPIGTYVPREHPTGDGLFVLNTATGEGWWVTSKGWKSLGTPGP